MEELMVSAANDDGMTVNLRHGGKMLIRGSSGLSIPKVAPVSTFSFQSHTRKAGIIALNYSFGGGPYRGKILYVRSDGKVFGIVPEEDIPALAYPLTLALNGDLFLAVGETIYVCPVAGHAVEASYLVVPDGDLLCEVAMGTKQPSDLDDAAKTAKSATTESTVMEKLLSKFRIVKEGDDGSMLLQRVDLLHNKADLYEVFLTVLEDYQGLGQIPTSTDIRRAMEELVVKAKAFDSLKVTFNLLLGLGSSDDARLASVFRDWLEEVKLSLWNFLQVTSPKLRRGMREKHRVLLNAVLDDFRIMSTDLLKPKD